MIKALAACAVVVALAACTTPITRSADGTVPPARVYIKSMTEEATGLSRIDIARDDNIYSRDMLELSINDVVLAQIATGEHVSIWLKPGNSYTLSTKPAYGLKSPVNAERSSTTVDVATGKSYTVQIKASIKGVSLEQSGR